MDDGRSLLISRRLLIAGGVGTACVSLIEPAWASDLAVIVNSGNREQLSRSDLAAIFTTRKRTWKGGDRIIPFNFPAKHSVRVAFDKAILGMSADDVARYWIDRRIRGGNPPPKQVSNASLIVRLVARMEGAVGYLPRSSVSDGVRVVTHV